MLTSVAGCDVPSSSLPDDDGDELGDYGAGDSDDSITTQVFSLGEEPGGRLIETVAGYMRIRIGESPDEERKLYTLTTDAGKRVRLHFEESPELHGGDFVTATGFYRDDGALQIQQLERSERSVFRSDTPLQRIPTHHTVAILAVEEANIDGTEALTVANAPTGSLQHFYAEASRGIDTFSAEIFRRYRIKYSEQNCLWDNTYDISDAIIAAFEKDGHSASDYDHIAVVIPRSCGADWTGAWADIGGINDRGTTSFEKVSMFKDDSFDPWYLGHELGHNLGMNHSRSMTCGSVFYRSEGRGCAMDEYGNHNDVMGWGEGVYFGTPHERFMGWIDARRVVTAYNSGTFNLQPSDGPNCGIQALRIPIPGEQGGYFYVEYRRARSDSLYAGTGQWNSTRTHAVLITHSRDGVGDSSQNERLEVGTSRYQGAVEGFVYDLGEVAVKVVSFGDSFARVQIESNDDGLPLDDAEGVIQQQNDGSFGATTCVPSPADNCQDIGGCPGGETTSTGSDTGGPTNASVIGCSAGTAGSATGLVPLLLYLFGLAVTGRRRRRP